MATTGALRWKARRKPACSPSAMTTRSGATNMARASASTNATKLWARNTPTRRASASRRADVALDGLPVDKDALGKGLGGDLDARVGKSTITAKGNVLIGTTESQDFKNSLNLRHYYLNPTAGVLGF